MSKIRLAKAKIKDRIKAQMGEGATDKQVEQALNAMMKATRGREPHLEIARVFDLPGYSRDPKTVLTKHFTDAYKPDSDCREVRAGPSQR